MPLLSDVTTRVALLVGSDAAITTAQLETLAQNRYEEIYEMWPWSRRTRDFTISTFAQVKSGASNKVTVTNGSSTVTAAGGAPFTSTVATTVRQILLGTTEHYFFINSRTDDNNIVIGDGEGNAVTWPGATASSVSWSIFQTIYTLPTTADAILSLSVDQFEMEELSGGRNTLDQWDPSRTTTAERPTHWFYAGVNSSNVREIEVWPTPTTARILRGQHVRTAPTLSAGSTIDIPVILLVYATAVDAAHELHSKQGSTESPLWENKILFWERKYNELLLKYKAQELERLSPPVMLGKREGGYFSRLRGTDFEVDRDLNLFP